MDLKSYLAERRSSVDEALDKYLPEETGPAGAVMKAMRYSVFAGGKRVRPILCLAACEAVRGETSRVMPLACAIECIHTYSLIHDDLPAMDDDDFRRGIPTCHKAFGDAIAILAGDGLLTFAFQIIFNNVSGPAPQRKRLMEAGYLIADAAGVYGMVGGQVVDILSEGKEVEASVVDYIHKHKTGALISASIKAGGLAGGAGRRELELLSKYGDALGLAFQIVDDILDIEGDQEEMGKAAGADIRRKKATYPSVYGLAESKESARRLIETGTKSLQRFGPEAEPLRAIAHYIINRKK